MEEPDINMTNCKMLAVLNTLLPYGIQIKIKVGGGLKVLWMSLQLLLDWNSIYFKQKELGYILFLYWAKLVVSQFQSVAFSSTLYEV